MSFDYLGSVRKIIKENGNFVGKYDYDVFGKQIVESENKKEIISNAYAYTSRELDRETDTLYYRSRYYDPLRRAFFSQDPLGFSAGSNLYSYVQNNPITFIDPLGLCKVVVRFAKLGSVSKDYYHAYIVSYEPDGSGTYFRGGPSAGGPSSGTTGAIGSGSCGSGSAKSQSSSSASNSSNSTSPGSGQADPQGNAGPWGKVTTDYGQYTPGTIDWDPGNPPAKTILSNNAPCDAYNAKFINVLNKIDAANIPYNPFSTNSNATVSTTLRKSGLPPGASPVWAPGWDTKLIN